MTEIKFEKMFWNSFLGSKWISLSFEEKLNIALTWRDRFSDINDLKASFQAFFWKEWLFLFNEMFYFIKECVNIDDFTLAFIINETRHNWWDMIQTLLLFFWLLNKNTDELLKAPF